jgi:hypothetical protein
MAKLTPTPEESAILRTVLDDVDPPLDGVDVGLGKVRPQHDTTWTRASDEIPGVTRPDGTIVAAGQTVQATGFEDDGGDVELPTATGHAVLDEPGPLALGEKIIAAVGELPGSNREFSLEFSFREIGIGSVG